MEAKDFHEKVNGMVLSSKERGDVWNIFKAEGIEKALSYLEKIEQKNIAAYRNVTLLDTPVPYQIWGKDFIESGALIQMEGAARLPVAVAGSLMPDAHQGYGLPIGGVLATENAVIPYAVGVDIACRMMLTVYPVSSQILENQQTPEYKNLYTALMNNTVFGAGAQGIHQGKIDHPILEKSNWTFSKLVSSLRDTAIHQIGTSGSGNHFVEWGELEITDVKNPFNLKIGKYLALLSHSGSRGVGFKIANHYTELAMSQLAALDPAVKHLAWLALDQDTGREYWESMELAGEFASANHHVIHERVAKAAGLTAVGSVENHHNFAWREKIIVNGVEKEVIVHRKGATPAGKGVLGIIPGTMADPGYLVVGKGNAKALNSASHGSGRRMSRAQAKKTISQQQHVDYLKQRGIQLIGGGLDESPQAYKPIEDVIVAQKDLVDILGKFQPKIVRMASDDKLRRKERMPRGIVEGQ